MDNTIAGVLEILHLHYFSKIKINLYIFIEVIFYGKIPVRISEAANRRTDTTMTERKNDKKANKIKQNTQKWRLSSTNITTRRV